MLRTIKKRSIFIFGILFSLLALTRMNSKAQVTLLFPDDNETLTDIAVSFKAKILSSGPHYLYVSRTADFSGDVIRRPAQTGKGEIRYNTQYFLTYQGKITPNDRFVLEPGVWYWRVSGDGGNTFSETRKLNVTDEKPLTPAEWDISPESPFFHMRMRSDLADHAPNGDIEGQLKKIIPDELKDVVVLDLGQSFHWLPDERSLYEYCKIFDDLGYKYVFDLGSHVWLGRIASLGEMEKVFRDLDHCVGGSIAEVFYYIFYEEAERSMIDGALELSRKYGKKLLHSDMNWRWAKWQYFNYLYYDIFEERQYADYYLPQFKTTSPWGTNTNISALQGMKLSGMVKDIGIWSDWWTWEKFGQVNQLTLKDFLDGGHDTDNQKTYPFMQNMKNYIWGITFGSTTFALEYNLQWHWQTVEPNDHYFRYLRPFIEAVVSEKLIPSEKELSKNFKVIVDTKFPSDKMSDSPTLTYVKGNIWGDMLRSTYGISNIDAYHEKAEAGGEEVILASYAEMIPNTDRYPSGIPFLPKPGIETPQVNGKALDVVSMYDLNSRSEANQNLNKYYPESSNEAYARRIDSSLFVFNTYENHDIRQSYKMGIHFAGIDSMMGDVDLMSYVVGRCRPDGKTIFFQANAYVRNSSTWNSNGGRYELPNYPTIIRFKCQTQPVLQSEKLSAFQIREWDQENGILTLKINHTTAGAVNFTLSGNENIEYIADSIQLDHKQVEIKVGEQMQLSGDIYPSSLKGKGLSWRSLNPNIATISSSGILSGISKGHVACIASIGEIDDTTWVKVSNVQAQRVDVQESSISINFDESHQLNVNVEPDYATDTTVIWISRDPDIVTVKQSGMVTAVGEGSVYVIAKNEDTGLSDSCLVIANVNRVQEIDLGLDTLQILIGQTQAFTAEIIPGNADFNEITWESADHKTVSITRIGGTRALKVGESYIYAINDYSGVKDSCLVMVLPIAANELSIFASREAYKPEESIRFFFSIEPGNTTDKSLFWSSQDTNVVQVTQSGRGTAINEGITYVLAENEASGLRDSFRIVVDHAASLDHLKKKSVKVFPNPVKKGSKVIIHSVYPTDISLLDALGKECLTKVNEQQHIEIETGNLNPGMYLITMKNKQERSVCKLYVYE